MELISLILVGIALMFYVITLLSKHNREISISGAIAGVLAVCSILTEEWNDYTIYILMLAIYLAFMLMGGALIDYDRE